MRRKQPKTARHGGGPITLAGKHIVRRNSTKHGLTSENLLLRHESAAEWQTHLRQTVESLGAVGRLETDLAERAAWITWRMRRVMSYESAVGRYQAKCRKRSATVDFNPPDKRDIVHLASLPDGKALEKVLRYEAHLQRQLDKTLDRLATLQHGRRAPQQSVRIMLVALKNENCETNSREVRHLPLTAQRALPSNAGPSSDPHKTDGQPQQSDESK